MRLAPVTRVMIPYRIITRFFWTLSKGIYIEAYIVVKNNLITVSEKLNENDYLDIYNSVMEDKFKNIIFKGDVDFSKILPEIKGLQDYNLIVDKIILLLNNHISKPEIISPKASTSYLNWCYDVSVLIGNGIIEYKWPILGIATGIFTLTYLYFWWYGISIVATFEALIRSSSKISEISNNASANTGLNATMNMNNSKVINTNNEIITQAAQDIVAIYSKRPQWFSRVPQSINIWNWGAS